MSGPDGVDHVEMVLGLRLLYQANGPGTGCQCFGVSRLAADTVALWLQTDAPTPWTDRRNPRR